MENEIKSKKQAEEKAAHETARIVSGIAAGQSGALLVEAMKEAESVSEMDSEGVMRLLVASSFHRVAKMLEALATCQECGGFGYLPSGRKKPCKCMGRAALRADLETGVKRG